MLMAGKVNLAISLREDCDRTFSIEYIQIMYICMHIVNREDLYNQDVIYRPFSF